jgi:hypothetical protein
MRIKDAPRSCAQARSPLCCTWCPPVRRNRQCTAVSGRYFRGWRLHLLTICRSVLDRDAPERAIGARATSTQRRGSLHGRCP